MDILKALAESKQKEKKETTPQDKNLNNGFSYISDGVFEIYLKKFGFDKYSIKDAFEFYDVGDRDFLLDYLEIQCKQKNKA